MRPYKAQVFQLQAKVQELGQKLAAALQDSGTQGQGRKEKRLEAEVDSLRKEQDELKQKLKDASRNVEAARK